MTTKRSSIVDPFVSSIYHCISRCVRRSSLIDDPKRRGWLQQRLAFLAQFGAIDVITFAIMRNHMHLLLRTHPELVSAMSDREVAWRWRSLLRTKSMVRAGIGSSESEVTDEEVAQILCSPRRIAKARRDLSELGFFHRLLKEPCARRWNREEDVTGHFWDGRFKSPRVLDDQALLAVSAYIDLNEIHAGAARDIESSVWSSVCLQWKRLLESVTARVNGQATDAPAIEAMLSEVAWEPVYPCCRAKWPEASVDSCLPSNHAQAAGCLPLKSVAEYIDLVDRVGRELRSDKACRILPGVPRALGSLLNALTAKLGQLATPSLNSLTTGACMIASNVGREIDTLVCRTVTATLEQIRPTAWLGTAQGTCYGSRDLVRLEAMRRGRSRLNIGFTLR